MVAGITDRLWSLADVPAKMEVMAAGLAKRGPYERSTQSPS